MQPETSPVVAYYGDDFTGSVDVILQLQKLGWRGRLFLGTPPPAELRDASRGYDVVGIAGIARSLPVEQMADEVRPALSALAALRPRVLQYKACSTADSSPALGNLGRVIELAAEFTGQSHTVPVLFAQPDFGRYTVFGHHFAAEGGVVYRLDRQPTMSKHPATPMRESHLATHLAAQTSLPVGSLTLDRYVDASSVAAALRETSDAATVLDAVDDGHLRLLGSALTELADEGTLFVLGSGGLSTALGHGLARASEGGAAEGGLRTHGPVLAVSGSRSPQTSRQIAHAVAAGWARCSLDADSADDTRLAATVRDALASGRSIVVDTDAFAPDAVPSVATVAERLGRIVETALRADATGRVIVCGGDTSSRLLTLLGASSLEIAANPMGNVVVCRVSSPHDWLDGSEMLLKGGQVGPVELFELVRAL